MTVMSKHSFWIDKAIVKWYLEMDHSFISHSQFLDKEIHMYSVWTLIRQLSKGQLLFLMQQETEFKAGIYFLFFPFTTWLYLDKRGSEWTMDVAINLKLMSCIGELVKHRTGVLVFLRHLSAAGLHANCK